MLESRKNSKAENCLKIRTLPTRPLHAMLDELLIYRDYDFDYSLKPISMSAMQEVKKRQFIFGQTKP